MRLQEITDYRSKIMKILCSDKEIVKLLTEEETPEVPNRDLMYNRIFPYAYTPDTVKEANTYIDFCVNVSGVSGKTYKTMGVTFYIFTHQSKMRTSEGLRPDLIARAIDEMFNGRLGVGLGRMELEGMDDINPALNFHGLAVEYSVKEFNRTTVGGNAGNIR